MDRIGLFYRWGEARRFKRIEGANDMLALKIERLPCVTFLNVGAIFN